MSVKEIKVDLGWGPAKLSGTWVPDTTERAAAWELYVELVTRISVAPMAPGHGTLREALTSLYQLFGSTREILRKHGPAVARKPKNGRYRFGYLAVWVLNAAIRPVLARWHPELLRWESARPVERSIPEHEEAWHYAPELREELERLRVLLVAYARLLAEVSDAPALIDATDDITAAQR
ncbi:hypothetical protein ACWEO2_02485 [Nocardia sp. NPDC004278]